MVTLWAADDVDRLKSLEAPVLVVGEEVAPDTGRLHFHAYVRFANARTFRSLHLQFPNGHFEVPRSSEDKCIQYCKKEGKVIVDRVVVCDSVAVAKVANKSGQVEVEVHRRLREGESIRSIWSDHPIYCARNMRMLRAVVRIYEAWGHRDDASSVDNLSGLEL